MRQTLFISYNRVDKRSLSELKEALKPYTYTDEIVLWSDDKKIPIGAEWESEIEKAIEEARVALLIITRNFFESEYIARKELLRIFKRHSHDGLDIWPIPFEETTPEVREHYGLSKIQWPRPPEQPLSDLSRKCRMSVLDQICGKLVSRLGLLGHTSKTTRDKFGPMLADSLRREYLDLVAIAPGDVSIVYKAKSRKKKTSVAIKAILPSMQRQWVADEFFARARACTKVRDSRFMIRTYEVRKDEEKNLSYAVMELLENVDTLDNRLRQFPEGLEPRFVAGILAELAYAASELHGMDPGAETGPFLLGPLRPRNVFVSNGKARVSPLRISGVTLRSYRGRPTIVLDWELTYLTPEQFHGDAPVIASDQYYLGLLGVELLRGKPIIEVTRFTDLLEKRCFFEAPAAALEDIRQAEPALFFVLARMLEPKPEDRWPDVKSVGQALEEIRRGVTPKEVRVEARRFYDERLQKQWTFYKRFYETLRKDPTVDTMFKGKKMGRIHRKLNEALRTVVYSDPEAEPTILADLKERPQHRNLTSDHYQHFKEAFLEALAELNPPPSHFTKAAWGAVLDVAIAHMCGGGGVARSYESGVRVR
jgi:serine/threonine protein kinase